MTPSSTEIVNRLLETDPDELSPEGMKDYLMTDYMPRYQKGTVDLSGAMLSDDRKLSRAFSWLTRIGAAPKFGTLPIQYYQQDQFKAIDAINAAAKAKGVETGWARYRNGQIFMFSAGKWVPIARLTLGTITPVP
jgi:hypothetical protein